MIALTHHLPFTASAPTNLPPVRIDLVKLANRSVTPDDLFEIAEEQCKQAVDDGVSEVVVSGLNELLETKRNAHHLRYEIETRMDEMRRVGEVSLPIFNLKID